MRYNALHIISFVGSTWDGKATSCHGVEQEEVSNGQAWALAFNNKEIWVLEMNHVCGLLARQFTQLTNENLTIASRIIMQ